MGSSSDGEWQHQSREKRHVLLAPAESWNPVDFKFQVQVDQQETRTRWGGCV
jgi:hypothetical protein